MSDQDNRRLAEQMFAALNSHDLNRYVSMLDEGYDWRTEMTSSPVVGPQAMKQTLEGYLRAFPDMHFEQQEIIASNDRVIACWELTATHRGEFSGIPATNKQIRIQGCTVHRMRGSKIIASRVYADHATLFQQIGVLSLGGKTMRA